MEMKMALSGMKNTKQRQKLFDLFKQAGRSMSAEEIFAEPSMQDAKPALSTIYRNLDLLHGRGVLVKTIFPDGLARYELAGTPEHHHYLVCTHCNRRQTFDICPLQRMEESLEAETGFSITSHNLMLYGLCPECKVAQNSV
jgi:Fur family ferric uptake transcriptional regulator